jgi:hypothetical protein
LLRNPGSVPVPVLKHFSKSTLGFLAYNLAIGFVLHSFIDNAAHIGGLVAGFLVGFVLAPRRPAYQQPAPVPLPGEPAAAGPARTPAWQGLVGIGVVVALGLAAFYSFADRAGLGTKLRFGKGELYYKAPVTEAEAQKLGRLLQEEGFLTTEKETTVQVQKTGSAFQVRCVVVPTALDNRLVEVGFRELGVRIKEEVFNKQPVEIHFCDELLLTKRVITIPSSGDTPVR